VGSGDASRRVPRNGRAITAFRSKPSWRRPVHVYSIGSSAGRGEQRGRDRGRRW
jgi:hypothetical protein